MRPPSEAVATWGTHQEAASAALNQLLVADLPIPAGPELTQLLTCREAVIDALGDQLYQLGVRPGRSPGTLRGSNTGANTEAFGVTQSPATALGLVHARLPRAPDHARSTPLDALATPSNHPSVELWRAAGVELTAGAHCLSAAAARPWQNDPAAGWWVAGDTAVALEAVLVLDSHLRAGGALVDLGLPTPRRGVRSSREVNEQRMVTATCARMAQWYATNGAAELAVPAPADSVASRGPVRLVNGPSELAAAQGQLARYLHPARGPERAGQPNINAETVRSLTVNQLELCRRVARICEAKPTTAKTGGVFTHYGDLLSEIGSHTSRLVDVVPTNLSPAATLQQTEITSALRRYAHGVGDLNADQLRHLARSTHQVMRELATSARAEFKHNLRHQVRGQKATLESTLAAPTPKTGIYQALVAAIDAPPPPPATWTAAGRRASLRATLDTSPPAGLKPSPFSTGPERGR